MEQPGQFHEAAGRILRMSAKNRRIRALRLLCLFGIGAMLAGCGRCGDFWPWSQSQIGACHSDPPPQQQ